MKRRGVGGNCVTIFSIAKYRINKKGGAQKSVRPQKSYLHTYKNVADGKPSATRNSVLGVNCDSDFFHPQGLPFKRPLYHASWQQRLYYSSIRKDE